MKSIFHFTCFCGIFFCYAMEFSWAVKGVDRTGFYFALSSNSLKLIDTELLALKKMKQTSDIKAYTGTLLMKKAGLLKAVKEKVATFKEGTRLLEEEIDKFPLNVEFRFLRVTIQENAPGIVKYKRNLNEDKEMIIREFPALEADLKRAISDYARTSKILPNSVLQNN